MARKMDTMYIYDKDGNIKKERKLARNLWMEALASIADWVGLGGQVREAFYGSMGLTKDAMTKDYVSREQLLNAARTALTKLSNQYNFEYSEQLRTLPSGVSSIIDRAVATYSKRAKDKYTENMNKIVDFEKRIGDAQASHSAYEQLPEAAKATASGEQIRQNANSTLSSVAADISAAFGTGQNQDPPK